MSSENIVFLKSAPTDYSGFGSVVVVVVVVVIGSAVVVVVVVVVGSSVVVVVVTSGVTLKGLHPLQHM